MRVRIARHTDRLDELVVFYRDRVGLPETGRFVDHDGQAELEAVANRIAQPEVTPANPYWQAHARAFADPDGFQLLLVATR
jgi:hypothetical protein